MVSILLTHGLAFGLGIVATLTFGYWYYHRAKRRVQRVTGEQLEEWANNAFKDIDEDLLWESYDESLH